MESYLDMSVFSLLGINALYTEEKNYWKTFSDVYCSISTLIAFILICLIPMMGSFYIYF